MSLQRGQCWFRVCGRGEQLQSLGVASWEPSNRTTPLHSSHEGEIHHRQLAVTAATMTSGADDDGVEREACVGSLCFVQPHPLYLPPPFYGKLLGQVNENLTNPGSNTTSALLGCSSSIHTHGSADLALLEKFLGLNCVFVSHRRT